MSRQLLSLLKAQTRCIMEYCYPIGDNAATTHTNKLNCIQRKASQLGDMKSFRNTLQFLTHRHRSSSCFCHSKTLASVPQSWVILYHYHSSYLNLLLFLSLHGFCLIAKTHTNRYTQNTNPMEFSPCMLFLWVGLQQFE